MLRCSAAKLIFVASSDGVTTISGNVTSSFESSVGSLLSAAGGLPFPREAGASFFCWFVIFSKRSSASPLGAQRRPRAPLMCLSSSCRFLVQLCRSNRLRENAVDCSGNFLSGSSVRAGIDGLLTEAAGRLDYPSPSRTETGEVGTFDYRLDGNLR